MAEEAGLVTGVPLEASMHVSSVLQALAKASKKKLEEEEGLDYDEVVRKTGVFFRAGDLDSAEEVRSPITA